MPNGSTASCSPCSVAPTNSPVLAGGAVTGGQVYTFSASGSVDHGGGSSGSDGRPGVLYVHSGPDNGIGNITFQINALLGVFLDNSQPSTTGVPPALNFSTAASMDSRHCHQR